MCTSLCLDICQGLNDNCGGKKLHGVCLPDAKQLDIPIAACTLNRARPATENLSFHSPLPETDKVKKAGL
jgi:hypothetical protein